MGEGANTPGRLTNLLVLTNLPRSTFKKLFGFYWLCNSLLMLSQLCPFVSFSHQTPPLLQLLLHATSANPPSAMAKKSAAAPAPKKKAAKK